jgi:hypoxanthine phosphoribosyltransferase
MTKLSYLSWSSFGKESYSLAKKVKASKIQFDLVIGIARGGIPVAMVIGDLLNLEIDIVKVKSYTGIKERVKPKILTKLSKGIRGKKVLIVDDLIEYGDTMKTVMRYLNLQKPASIKTAVLYKKPWSTIEPDFHNKTVDTWIVFPWDIEETKRLQK